MTRRRGRRRRKVLDDLKDRRGYCQLKEEALDRPVWRNRFGRGCSPDTTPAEPHLNFNTQQTKKETTNVVIQQHSRKLLMMGILMPETC